MTGELFREKVQAVLDAIADLRAAVLRLKTAVHELDAAALNTGDDDNG